MKITVKLFAIFRNDRFKIEDQEYPNETTVGDVLTSLGIDHPELGVALVNARHVTIATVLTDGQTLSLFPKVGGG
jgi:molybdopterin converting factor small subunit